MRSKIVLILALFMGLTTTFLFYNYMDNLNKDASINQNTVDIVVAKESIKKNQIISSNMIIKKSVLQKSVHPQTIIDPKEAMGLYATTDLVPDEPLLKHHLQSQQEENLFVSKKIAPGHRAVSIGVNFVQSVSNLIEPGDFVDVIFSEVIKRNGEQDQIITHMLLENVPVLSIGRRMVEATSETPYVEYSSATLELSKEAAVVLVNARERGNIHLILHDKLISSKGGSPYD